MYIEMCWNIEQWGDTRVR